MGIKKEPTGDAKPRQSKSRPLDRALKVRIGRFKAKNPQWKITEIADKFHCTPDQARYAIIQYNEDQLKCTEAEPELTPEIEKLENVQEADAELEKQYINAVERLKNEKIGDIGLYVKLLDSCVKIRVLLDKMDLVYHLRKLDADIFSIAIRMYDPDKTNEEIYKIYKQAEEICKANKAGKKL